MMLDEQYLKDTHEILADWPKYAKSELEPDVMLRDFLEEVERLRFALAFYAEPKHWTEDGVCVSRDPDFHYALTFDEGWVARKALGMEPRHPRHIPDEEGTA